MKKSLSLILTLVCLVLLLALPASAATEIKGTLTILSEKDAWRAGYDDVCKQIEEQFGIATDVSLVDYDSMNDILGVKLATGDVPDIFITNAPQCVEQYNATVNCVALDDQPWVSRLVNQNILRYTGDNKIYAMPVIEPANFIAGAYYNVDTLASLGIVDPNPQSYEEFVGLCQQIKDAGITPLYMTDADSWCPQIWTTVGWGAVLDAQKDTIYKQLASNQIDFQDIPEMITVLQQLQDLYTAGFVNEDHLSASYETSFSAIAEGKAAMVINGEWFASGCKAAYPDCNLSSIAIPFMEGDKNMLGVGAYVIGAYVTKDGQSDLALEFLNLWSQPDQMKIIYAVNNAKSAFVDCESGLLDPSVVKFYDNYVSQGRTTNEFDSYFDSARPIMTDYLFANIVECVAGYKTPVQALTDWNTKYEQYMAEMGVEGF
jgi:raffinose/stachyose/melibiose transport system substrate-binding protein